MGKLHSFLTKCKFWFLLRTDPRILANIEYKRIFGKNIDWDNPHDLVEKFWWLEFYSDTTLWTLCADKYRVREFVSERGCSSCLNDLYGVWTDPSDIDWNKLPNNFVLKPNHTSGDILIVKDKSKIDKENIKGMLNNWLSSKYGYVNGQLHYLRIKPVLIAEKLLENTESTTKSLIDYKVWCFNGQPYVILVCFNRDYKGNYELSLFDTKWNNISKGNFNQSSPHYSGADVPKPVSLESMLEYAKKLSSGFPEVRVDFYESSGQPIFGELTFTTGYSYFSKACYNRMGEQIDLSKVKKNRKINRL